MFSIRTGYEMLMVIFGFSGETGIMEDVQELAGLLEKYCHAEQVKTMIVR